MVLSVILLTIVLVGSVVSNHIGSFHDFIDNDGLQLKKEIHKLIRTTENFNKKCYTGPYKQMAFRLMKKLNLTETTKSCVDPNPIEMMFKLVELFNSFRDMTGIINTEITENLFKDYMDTGNTKKYSSFHVGNKDCESDYGLYNSLTRQNELSLCPWHDEIVMRENRYPYMVSHARCNCDRCTQDDERFRCNELNKRVPALIRTDECLNGTIIWKPILESISVGCVCSRKPIMRPE